MHLTSGATYTPATRREAPPRAGRRAGSGRKISTGRPRPVDELVAGKVEVESQETRPIIGCGGGTTAKCRRPQTRALTTGAHGPSPRRPTAPGGAPCAQSARWPPDARSCSRGRLARQRAAPLCRPCGFAQAAPPAQRAAQRRGGRHAAPPGAGPAGARSKARAAALPRLLQARGRRHNGTRALSPYAPGNGGLLRPNMAAGVATPPRRKGCQRGRSRSCRSL